MNTSITCTLQQNILVAKSSNMRWVGHVAHTVKWEICLEGIAGSRVHGNETSGFITGGEFD